MDLNLVRTVFEIHTESPPYMLPQLFYAVRKFENYFKSVSCLRHDLSCNTCGELQEKCPFRFLFGQPLSSDPDILRRHQKPPLPFAFQIREAAPGSSNIELGAVLAGPAIQHLSGFYEAINLMIGAIVDDCGVNAGVKGSWCLDYLGERRELNNNPDSLVLLSGLEIVQGSQHSDTVKICLDSPLRLLCGGSVAHSFDFAAFLRSQLRRCSSFFAYYGEGELDLDYLYLSEAASKVIAIENDFIYKKPHWSNKPGLGGLSGSGEFTDLADGILPVLKLGSYLNAGKGAAYGMGCYRIEFV